jgi:hypothetical protein
MVRRSCRLVGGPTLKVHVKTAAAMIAAAILAVLAGSASALNSPTPPLPDGVPTSTQPVDPGDTPVPPVVTVPDNPAPVLPTVTPAHLQPLNGLLLKRVRTQIVLYRNKTWRLQSLIGQRHSPGGDLWNLGTPKAGKKTLQAWQNRSRQLRLAARQRIQQDRRAVEHMLLVMGQRPVVRTLASSGNIVEQLRYMNQLKNHTYKRYINPQYKSQLTCIHGGEGSWTDPNPPFWGGLQMNYGFMATYGPWLLRHKGTADHWTPLEQMWVAVKAISSGRGFWPWPNTARACGLIS